MTKEKTETMTFNLEGTEYIELKNLLKVSGICRTGGAAKAAIEEGLVSVDGVKETRKGLKVKVGQVASLGPQSVRVEK
jgi:ribosome-associated protein